MIWVNSEASSDRLQVVGRGGAAMRTLRVGWIVIGLLLTTSVSKVEAQFIETANFFLTMEVLLPGLAGKIVFDIENRLLYNFIKRDDASLRLKALSKPVHGESDEARVGRDAKRVELTKEIKSATPQKLHHWHRRFLTKIKNKD
jgi:hypothetical protein